MGYLSSTTPTLWPSKSSRTPYTHQQGNFLLNETSRQSQHSGTRPPFRITSSFGGNKVHTVYRLIAMALAILYSTFLPVALSDFQSFDRTDSFDIEAILEPVYSSAVARRGIFLPCRPGGGSCGLPQQAQTWFRWCGISIGPQACAPFRHFPGRGETRKKILKKGKVFQEIMSKDLEGHAYRHYKGPLWEKYDLVTPQNLR
jgi:hypothetical protein